MLLVYACVNGCLSLLDWGVLRPFLFRVGEIWGIDREDRRVVEFLGLLDNEIGVFENNDAASNRM